MNHETVGARILNAITDLRKAKVAVTRKAVTKLVPGCTDVDLNEFEWEEDSVPIIISSKRSDDWIYQSDRRRRGY